jgi:predicted transcriptional regulator
MPADSARVDTESVCTYTVLMNITISLDDDLLERARELARRRGTSLQALLREQVSALVGERSGTDIAAELMELMESHGGRSHGQPISRADAYERLT